MASVEVLRNPPVPDVIPNNNDQAAVKPLGLDSLPNRDQIKPSPETSLAESAFEAVAFAGQAYGLEPVAKDLKNAFNGDVLAGLGVLGTLSQVGKAKQAFGRISGNLIQDLKWRGKLEDIPLDVAGELTTKVKEIIALARQKVVDEKTGAQIASQAWAIVEQAQKTIYWLKDGPTPFSGPSPLIREELVGRFRSVYHTLHDALVAQVRAVRGKVAP